MLLRGPEMIEYTAGAGHNAPKAFDHFILHTSKKPHFTGFLHEIYIHMESAAVNENPGITYTAMYWTFQLQESGVRKTQFTAYGVRGNLSGAHTGRAHTSLVLLMYASLQCSY